MDKCTEQLVLVASPGLVVLNWKSQRGKSMKGEARSGFTPDTQSQLVSSGDTSAVP